LARPGGNTTGFASFEYSLSIKWLELLKQVAPRVTRVAVLRDSLTPVGIGQLAAIQGVAPSFAVELTPIVVRDAGEIEPAVAAFARSAIDSAPFPLLVTDMASRFWSALRTAGLSEIARVGFLSPAFIGSLLIFSVPPPPSMADGANDGLSARVHMHMLDRYVLLALAPFSRQGFDLHGLGAHEFGCQVAEDIQPFNAITFISMACNGAACTGDQFEQDNIRDSHVGCQHRFDLVFRPHPINDRQGGIECDLVGTTRTKIEVQRMVRGRIP
jgi:hypothetical protein